MAGCITLALAVDPTGCAVVCEPLPSCPPVPAMPPAGSSAAAAADDGTLPPHRRNRPPCPDRCGCRCPNRAGLCRPSASTVHAACADASACASACKPSPPPRSVRADSGVRSSGADDGRDDAGTGDSTWPSPSCTTGWSCVGMPGGAYGAFGKHSRRAPFRTSAACITECGFEFLL